MISTVVNVIVETMRRITYSLYYFVLFLVLFVKANNETTTSEPETTEHVDIKNDINDYNWDVWCKFQANSYSCNTDGLIPRYYYDVQLGDCRTFKYGGCATSYNNFKILSECHDACTDPGQHAVKVNITAKIFCRFQPDFGRCHEYHPMWYYDINQKSCRGFSYSGCGGNPNRFPNSKICNIICMPAVDP